MKPVVIGLALLSLSCVAGSVEDRGGYIFETLQIEMDDGIALSTDLYLPQGGGKFPVVLIRTPYDKAHPLGKAIGEAFTAQGIAMVAQDCRGRFASEGTFYAFRNERKDGLKTLEWIRSQSWFGGKVGGALGSYNGYTQLAVADQLDVVLDIVSCANMHDLIYPGELYSLETVHNWAFNMDSKTSNGLAPDAIRKSYWTLPLKESSPQAYGRENRFVGDWLTHEKYDGYWEKQNRQLAQKATVFSFAGWYDIFLMGQIADFQALESGIKAKSRLVIGPWAHGQHEIENGFGGKEATGDFEDLSLKLLAAELKGGDSAKLFAKPFSDVRYNLFIMERNEYFPSSTWPPKETKPTDYYLTAEGSLSPHRPLSPSSKGYLYDPANPYPSKGGTVLGAPAGQADQRANTSRTDQLVFDLPIFGKPLVLLGPIDARLFVETDAPSTDFFVLLEDIFPDGTVVNIQEGGAEYVPARGGTGLLEFSVWATGYQFNPGHTLRVVVTSSWFPRFNRNLNLGEPIATAQEMRKANQQIFFGKGHASSIVLPILER